MKLTKKLLAFVIAFAMVMSVMVMPVSAAEVNLVPTITAIEGLAITQTEGVKAPDATVGAAWANTRPDNPTTVGYELAEEDGESVIKVTKRQTYTATGESGLWITNVALKSGKTYIISADLRNDNFTPGRSRMAGFRIIDVAGSKATYLGGEGLLQADDASDSFGHRKAGMIGDSIQLATPGVNTNGSWMHVERTFTMGTNAGGTGELGATVALHVGDSGNYDKFLFSVKNVKIIEVDTDTLVPTIASISFPTINQYGGAKASASAAAPAWSSTRTDRNDKVVYELVEEAGEKVVKVTTRTNYDGHIAGVWLTNAAVKSGKTYKVSVDLRADAFTVAGRSRNAGIIIKDVAGSRATIVGGTGIEQSDVDSHRVTGMVGTSSFLTSSTGTFDNGTWKHYEAIFTMGTNTDNANELGANIGFQVGDSGNYATYLYSFKNFELVEVTPFTGTAVANGAKSATFTFSNNIATDPVFAPTVPEGAKYPMVNQTSENGVYSVKLAGYSAGTTYTITATGGADEFGQALAAPVSVDITTPAVEDGNIAGIITGAVSGDITLDGAVKASEAAAAPAWEKTASSVRYEVVDEDGTDVVKITARQSWSTLGGVWLANAPLQAGKTYTVSVDLRADAFTVTGRSRKAGFIIKDIEGSKASIIGGKNILQSDVDDHAKTGLVGETSNLTGATGVFENGTWKHIEETFTMGKNANGTAELGANIGFQVGDSGNYATYLYSFKNFKIVEVPSTAFVPENVDANYTIEVEDVDGQAVLTIAGADSTVYFMSYNEATKTVGFDKCTVSADGATASIALDANAKYMIWNSNMAPLCNAFMGSDI